MSSESKKVVNLDRPRESAAEEQRHGNAVDSNPKDDIDALLSDFLEHINTLSAEYESSGSCAEPEQPVPEIPSSPVSETIANMAAAVQPKAASMPPEERHDTAPLPFSRDTADLDEEIERALSALEELPATGEERPAEAGPGCAEPPPAAVAAPTNVSPAIEAPEPAETPVEPEETAQVISPVAPTPNAQEEVRPLFTYSSPDRAGRRRVIVALAIVGAVGLLALAIYLLAVRSRSVATGVGSETAAPPPAPASVETPQSPSQTPTETAIPAVENPLPAAPVSSAPRETRQRPRGTADRNTAVRNEPDLKQHQPETQKTYAPAAVAPSVVQQEAVPLVENTQQSAPAAAPPVTSPATSPPAQTNPPPATQSLSATPPAEAATPRSVESNNQQPPPAKPPAVSATPPPVTRPASPPATTMASPATVKSATPAELISKVLPSFPDFARRMNQTGKVDVEIAIDAQGRVTQAKAVSGPSVFYSAATDAVKKWVFKPATLNGNSVSSQGRVTVVFNKR